MNSIKIEKKTIELLLSVFFNYFLL
ncbi:uncharacterized protein METZ01_LOCUS242095 [marine metagenome]|uniref:Uncharacterized protein n=1 Tax=marine metagenome TaxID=408172 RepID=A0A382HRX2_9ZZZZ